MASETPPQQTSAIRSSFSFNGDTRAPGLAAQFSQSPYPDRRASSSAPIRYCRQDCWRTFSPHIGAASRSTSPCAENRRYLLAESFWFRFSSFAHSRKLLDVRRTPGYGGFVRADPPNSNRSASAFWL